MDFTEYGKANVSSAKQISTTRQNNVYWAGLNSYFALKTKINQINIMYNS